MVKFVFEKSKEFENGNDGSPYLVVSEFSINFNSKVGFSFIGFLLRFICFLKMFNRFTEDNLRLSLCAIENWAFEKCEISVFSCRSIRSSSLPFNIHE